MTILYDRLLDAASEYDEPRVIDGVVVEELETSALLREAADEVQRLRTENDLLRQLRACPQCLQILWIGGGMTCGACGKAWPYPLPDEWADLDRKRQAS